MSFLEEIKKTYEYKPHFENMRRAEKELLDTGKYEKVSCSSSKKHNDMETVDCLVVKPLTDNIKDELDIRDEEQEDRILSSMLTYNVEPCEEHLTESEFIEKYVGDEPAYPYAVSSVERNMYRSGADADMINACINPYGEKQTEKIKERIEKNLDKTPYTRWSGD